jgi:hypothetical protein
MQNRLNHYLQTNNIPVPKQFGFREGICNENSAFRLIDSVLKSINKKMHVGGICCDLVKALNCVNHEILLTKLHFWHSRSNSKLIQILPNRKQKIIKIIKFNPKHLLKLGNNRAWNSPAVNFKAFAFHNLI